MVKKVLFLFICFFCLSSVVFAEKYLYITDLEEGNSVLNETFTNVDIVSGFNGSGPDDLIVSFYNKENVLLESYGIPYYAVSKLEHNIGLKCIDAYERAKSGSSFNCSLGQEGIYSSGRDISEIKYWKIFEYYHYDGIGTRSFYDFCLNNKETHNSRICSDLIFKSIFEFGTSRWHYVGFIEYEPVTFNLICEDENLKSGEEVSCKLKVNAEEEIKDFTIVTKNDLYEIVNYSEVEGWKVLDNKNGTITVKSDAGFKGINYAVNFKFKLANNKTENVNLEIKDFDYTIYDGNVLKSSTSDNVSIKKDEVVNPNTKDFNVILIVFIVMLGCLSIIALKPKKIYS